MRSSECGVRNGVHSALHTPNSELEYSALRTALGFTLVELCIVALLVTIIAGGLLTTFLAGQTSYVSNDAYIQVQQEARRAFDNVVRELRESGNINLPSTQRIDFQVALRYDASACGGICWGSEVPATPWVHYVITTGSSNNQLIRCLTLGPNDPIGNCTNTRVLANNVRSDRSAFEWDSTEQVVTLRLEVEYCDAKLPGGTPGSCAAGMGRRSTGVLSSRVKLRNS